MTSKDALEILNFAWSGRLDDKNYPDFDDINIALYTIKKDIERLEKINYIQSSFINEVRKYITQLQTVYNDKGDYYNLYIRFYCRNEKDLFDILTTLKLKEEYETIRCSKEVTK